MPLFESQEERENKKKEAEEIANRLKRILAEDEKAGPVRTPEPETRSSFTNPISPEKRNELKEELRAFEGRKEEILMWQGTERGGGGGNVEDRRLLNELDEKIEKIKQQLG